MYKIGVLGDKESIMGFRAIGIDTFIVNSADEAINTLKEVSIKNYGIVFITERVISMIPVEIKRYRSLSIPALIPIPDNKGTLGIGMEWVKDSVIKAIGADILQ